MKIKQVGAVVFLLALSPGYAAATPHSHATAYGSPGLASDVNKTIHVQATDQMRLLFDSTQIRVGDVVRFVVTNSGKVPHEFGIMDQAGQRQHAQEMMQMPMMEHQDANMVSLKPGETRTLIWSFKQVKTRNLVFACNLPGHYQSGMFVRLTLGK